MPFFARGWAVRREGMVLFRVALARLARAALRKEAGGRPAEGVSRPMVVAFCFGGSSIVWLVYPCRGKRCQMWREVRLYHQGVAPASTAPMAEQDACLEK